MQSKELQQAFPIVHIFQSKEIITNTHSTIIIILFLKLRLQTVQYALFIVSFSFLFQSLLNKKNVSALSNETYTCDFETGNRFFIY